LLLSSRAPGRREVRTAAVVALGLGAACAGAVPFGAAELAHVTAFIPVVDTALLFSDLLTATLLFAQASVLRSRALVALATGYLFSALIIVPHGLTFPGAFSPTGLLGAGVNTTITLYFFWHATLPIAVICYQALKASDEQAPLDYRSVRRVIAGSAAAATVLVVLLTVLTTAGHELLPQVMRDGASWSASAVFKVTPVLAILFVAAIVTVLHRRASVLDLWLSIALWAWLLELVLLTTTSTRYSVGWYTGRIAGLSSGVFVLLALLSETNRLYARLAIAATTHQRERDSRLVAMGAVAASMVHEVKQPLAAIVANAHAGRRLLRRRPDGSDQLPAIFTEIAADGCRAVDVVEGVRALFGGPRTRAKLDVNSVIVDAVATIAGELAAQRIAVDLRLTEGLPFVDGDSRQINLALLNLLTNAQEAMASVVGRARTITVWSTLDKYDLLIAVEDSGAGIDPERSERIFEPFFTTKPRGSGMGLYLCRSIVEQHGGSVRAEPRDRAGTVFTITLPVAVD
jgi:signal transduction histidine kinase